MRIEHRLRETLLATGERIYRLEDDRLSVIEPDGAERTIELAAIRKVALGANPGRYNAFRHVATLSLADGTTLRMSNCHFRGLADFEDRSDSYRAVMEALLGRLAQAQPQLPVRTGSTPLAYWTQVIGVALLFLALAYVLLAFLPAGGPSAWQWLKLAIIVGMLPVFVLWLRVRRPRHGTAAVLPPGSLPPASL
jgi:hypothetical protein